MKNKKKGFTLVELLVVIAILAILATVSILGYTSFTGKAKASNAEQELSQMKTMFLADWLDGFVGKAEDQFTIVKNTTNYEATIRFNLTGQTTQKSAFDTDLQGLVKGKLLEAIDDTDAGSLKDKVSFEFGANPTVSSTTIDADGKCTVTVKVQIEKVVYASANGYTAKWTINGDTIKADPTSN